MNTAAQTNPWTPSPDDVESALLDAGVTEPVVASALAAVMTRAEEVGRKAGAEVISRVLSALAARGPLGELVAQVAGLPQTSKSTAEMALELGVNRARMYQIQEDVKRRLDAVGFGSVRPQRKAPRDGTWASAEEARQQLQCRVGAVKVLARKLGIRTGVRKLQVNGRNGPVQMRCVVYHRKDLEHAVALRMIRDPKRMP